MSETAEIEQHIEDPATGLLHREFAAEITAVEGRTVDVVIVPYGERITHNDGLGGVPVGVEYQEEWAPGVFAHQMDAAHRVVANVEHERGIAGIVGHGIALREERDGTHGSFKIHKTPVGDTTLELINDGVLSGVSLEAKPRKAMRTAEGVIRRVKADLRGVAFTRFHAYAGAKVLAVREEAEVVDATPKEFLPQDIDPELIERCRRLGIALPQRYQAHPDEADTPDDPGTSASGTRQPDDNHENEQE